MQGAEEELSQDMQVVQSVLAGDSQQMNALVRAYTPFLERTLVARGAQSTEAEDVVASLWLDCLPRPGTGESLLHRFKGTLPLRAWLRTVAVRRLIDYKRRQWRRPETPAGDTPAMLHDRPAPACPTDEGEDLRTILRQSLQHALGSCSTEELVILRLVHLHGLTQREIGLLWNTHESRISRILAQAMRRIEIRSLFHARTLDPWLELTWKDFLSLCEAERIL